MTVAKNFASDVKNTKEVVEPTKLTISPFGEKKGIVKRPAVPIPLNKPIRSQTTDERKINYSVCEVNNEE